MKRVLKRFLVAALLLIAVANGAWAIMLSDAQLFYDPWQVPEDQYPKIDMTTSPGNRTASCTWAYSDVMGVQVLPLLNPYTPTDPAGYPPTYVFTQSDYYYQPNLDYFVDLNAGVAQATFNKPGIYHVKLDRALDPDPIYAVFVDSGLLHDNKTCPSARIPGPTADVVVVSKPTTGDKTLDDAASNATDDNGADKVKRAKNSQSAVDQIKAASQKAGKQIHVELVCHGNEGLLMLGDTQIGGAGGMSMADFQKAIDPFVNNLSIYACYFAGGTAGNAAMITLVDSLGKVTAFTGLVSVHSSWWDSLIHGSWDLQIGKAKVTVWSPAAIIANSKVAIDGAHFEVSGATVSASFPPNSIYIEADNRACGIRVDTNMAGLIHTGMKVNVEGMVMTDPATGERFVQAVSTIPEGMGMIEPLATTVRSLGGGPFGKQEGIAGAMGLNNIGLLVRAVGMLSYIDPNTYILYDGSEFVKCIMPTDFMTLSMAPYAAVTGISSCERTPLGLSRVLKVRDLITPY